MPNSLSEVAEVRISELEDKLKLSNLRKRKKKESRKINKAWYNGRSRRKEERESGRKSN